MTSFKKHAGDADGWSEWVNPRRRGYKMACCDCGLVHIMEFDVMKFESATSEAGTVVNDPSYGVIFRAKRNARSTGQIRRHMAKLRSLGTPWLERSIDRAKVKERT